MFLLWHVTGGTTIDILIRNLFTTGTRAQCQTLSRISIASMTASHLRGMLHIKCVTLSLKNFYDMLAQLGIVTKY